MKKKTGKPDPNVKQTGLEEFMEYYNSNIPKRYPRATRETLEEFKSTHENLFDRGGKWTRDKHRKRVMDWLSSTLVGTNK